MAKKKKEVKQEKIEPTVLATPTPKKIPGAVNTEEFGPERSRVTPGKDVDFVRDPAGNIIGKNEGGKFIPTASSLIPPRETGQVLTGAGDKPAGVELPDGRTFLGLNPNEVRDLQQQQGIQAGQGVGGAGEAAALSSTDKLAAQQQLQEIGAFGDITPETEINLQPERMLGEGIPVIGPGQAGLSAAWAHWFKTIPYLKDFVGEPGTTSGEEAFIVTDDMSAREVALNQIRIKNYDKGIKAANAFGSLVEAVPILGSVVGKYAGGLVDTPLQKVEVKMAEIDSERERAATSTEKVNSNLIKGHDGMEIAKVMHENVAALEGEMAVLIATSPELRSNPEAVDKYMENIARARERIEQYYDASTYAVTRELTGQGTELPSNVQIFEELKEHST